MTAAAAAAVVTCGASAQQRPTGPTAACVNDACHASIAGRPFMHEPVARNRCLECHEYAVPEQHLFRLTAPRSDLCGSCHELRLWTQVHKPVADGNCTGCHDPHGSSHAGLLLAPATAGLCTTCHEQEFDDREFVHGPVVVGACVVCHEPHSSPHAALLPKAPGRLCLDCHRESAPQGIAARHQHAPMEQGCTTCHDPHASDFRFQLHDRCPDLCFTCHEGVKKLVENATVVHGLVHDPDGCVRCHDPHFTQLPRLQRREQPELCLDCHDRPVQTVSGATLTDMALLLHDNPNQHGPIREGACTACHQPHGADHFRLLFKEYPPEFYAPYEKERYALCFSCHLPELVEDESGTGLTGFREGDRNLHWVHVNQEKGRSCRACHEVHASKRPFHIREAVPFGTSGWMLEINYEKTEDGGSCLPGCHKAKTYRRSGGPPPATGDEP